MVIRVPEFSGVINTKARVLVPCQCLYNSRDDCLTEINHYEGPINKIRSYPTQNSRKENNDLWNRRFNRWWGWNWQRKRKDFLRKFGIKTYRSSAGRSHFKEEPTTFACETNSKTDESNRTPTVKYCSKLNSRELIHHPFAPLPLPPFYTCGLRKQYTGRRRRRKREQREHQAWLREMTTSSSDSDLPATTSGLRFKDRSLQQQCSYFKRRLRNLHSSDETAEPSNVKTLFKSPLSGQMYDLTIPKLTLYTGESKIAECLEPVSIKNDNFLPKVEFEWLEKYNFMQKEHTALITTICEIICASCVAEHPPKQFPSKTVNASPIIENPIMYHTLPTQTVAQALPADPRAPNSTRSDGFLIQKFETVNASPIIENPIMYHTLQTRTIAQALTPDPPAPNRTRSDGFLIQKSETVNASPIIENPIMNHTLQTQTIAQALPADPHAPNKTRSDGFLIQKARRVDNLYAIQSESILRACDSIILSNSSYEDAHDSNYDLNYIANNLSSFTSFISDIEFMICEPETAAVNEFE